MAEDLKRNLLKKGGNFEKLFEQCVIRIQRIKQKNDYLQRKIGPNSDELGLEIHEQTQFIEKQIKQIKQFMIEMQNKYKDPESKNRLKQLKLDTQKQIERNKLILKDVVVKSFIRKSKNLEEDDDELIEKVVNISPQKKQNKKQSMLTEQQIQIDYDVERKMLKEKNEMLNEVQQSTQRINQMMNDMVLVVEQQGNNLEMISEQMLRTNKNLMATNNDLEQASNLQKKSKKKYIILVVIILILLIMAGGIVYFLLN